jgi:Stress responsive A/B Barrel Domain
MIRHVVTLTWQPEATDEQKQLVSTALAALPGLIPGVRGYTFGPDAGISDGNADFAIVADFDDAADYATYRDHPEHLKVLSGVIRPILAQRAAVQFEI